MSKEDNLKFKGLSLSKEQFQERFEVNLSDIEWKVFKNDVIKQWEEDIDQIRSLAMKYMRDQLKEMGYKSVLKNGKLTFIKN